ncbi:hypothetical protein PYW08_010570 [Mythimna loreyi]|uniref:Uncharacterized protein n=1 Tax=Mythimna loreyi TaxID=667449 RepID=A0ACC2Q3A9_9NEOP|nr:hypothetical protein PYW08_010570 [Mythimna loreyi]
MPLPFNKNLDLKLLKLVKENPILYNTRHAKYLDFDSREVVWQKIGDSLSRPALVCKSRWINIRDMMRRKFRERLKNPNAHSYKYKYEEELSFMTPYFKEPISSGSTAEEYAGFLEDETCEVEMPSEVFVDEALDFEEARETKPVFRKRQQDDGNSSREFSEAMFQELSPTDPLDVFLLTIGSTLRKFSPYYLNQAKSKIFQVVQDYELQQIVNKEGQAGSSDAVKFAGMQCQIQLGDYDEKKHKSGFIEKLEEYLPEQYSSAWGMEKKIVKEYATHVGSSELDAKFLYIKTARSLPTYGVTFFLVKEKQKDKKKLVPRLLGINAEAILRLDEVTKEILQQWPLTHVKTYHAGKSQTFTLNFGDYSDKEYSVKTQDCHRIRDILEGYIDIIRRRMLAKPSNDPGESMVICHDNVQSGKGNVIEMCGASNPTKLVTESFVGPSRIVTSDQGSQSQSGTMLTTVQQIIVTDHLKNQQQALKGEMPLRGDMSQDCIRKLNRMNANSVKIVELLTDPTDTHVKDVQQIVRSMQEDFPVVEKGVKETADKQAIEDARKMLLDELQDLNNFMNKLTGATEPGKVNPTDAKDAAESIADLTTQMYFSIDPKTRRRSDFLRRSRKSFKEGEKTEQTLRRASFIAAATTALHSVDTAAQALHKAYTGPKLDEEKKRKLERALEDKLSKLNAAIAQYLMAHSDPDNIDYATAINSMNTINELMPAIAKDGPMLVSTKDPAAGKELQEELRGLVDSTKRVCSMSGEQDHEKMQQATNEYADVAGKLLYKFSKGANAKKENEIIELAKHVGDQVSRLLVTTNELTCQASAMPAAANVDEAGVRTAGAARDLLHTAELTAPAIHEPHCQSALTAASANLAGAVNQLETTWKPLVEDPTRQHMADLLHTRKNDVLKALDRLRDGYWNLEVPEDDVFPLQEKKRLKFISTLSGAKNRLLGVKFDEWNKPSTDKAAPSEEEKAAAQRRLEHTLAQLNAAVAALAAATADRENPDYETAELAVSTITELMPQIAKDMEVVSSDKDEATRAAMQKNLYALCDACKDMCDGDGYQHAQGEPLANFTAASGKLVFLVSPGADKGKQKHIQELSSIAQQQASELASCAQQVKEHAVPGAADEIARRADQAQDDAQALLSVAQATAASMSSPRCRDALSAAVSKLQGSAERLAATCRAQHSPQTAQSCAAVKDAHQQLSDSLARLGDVCEMGMDESADDSVSPAQREKQRLKFVQSAAGAKRRLDAAAQQLTKPMTSGQIRIEDTAVLEQQLSERLALLNAAVAALVAATADRENPDYVGAEKAVDEITALMPHVVREARLVYGSKGDAAPPEMLQDIKALVEASKELCDSVGQPQGVADAAARFTAASRTLVSYASPGADVNDENEIMGLSADVCGKASDLLTQVQHLTELIPDAAAAAELDSRGARAADAAQAFLTVAQATTPTISNANCQRELVSAAEKLRSTASELTSSCQPHLQQRPDMKQQVLASHQQLNDSLDKLVDACNSVQGGTQRTISPADKEKRRLKFVNTLSGAKNRLYDSEQQLKQPLTKQPLQPEEAKALEQRLNQRLARLNAAIAALAAANADAGNPDYVAAEKAVKEISDLMPLIVQDSRKLSSTKDQPGQVAMLKDLKALCQASRNICENTENSPKVDTTDFGKAASKLVFLVSPAADKTKGKQVVELSDTACKQASQHLQRAQAAAHNAGPAVSAQLGRAGHNLQHAADTLHAVAHATAPTIGDPHCQKEVISAAENLRSSASDLTACVAPYVQEPEVKKQVLGSQQQLADSLDKLVQAVKTDVGSIGWDVPSAETQAKQRLEFINSVSGAKQRLDAAEQQLKQPMICQLMKQEDGAAMERKLSNRLAQLNAAVAALAAATADRERPNYAAADRAVRTITELMPEVVQDSHKLCGTKSGTEQAAMLQDLKALCEATRQICDSAGQPQGLSDAAAKFSAATGKLVYVVSPAADAKQQAQDKQVIALSAASCGKASELLTQAQRLTELIPDAAAAAELDSRGARAADAAQALLTVAQATAPTIRDPHCQKEVISAAEKLRSTASELTSSCQPHLQQRPEMKQQMLGSQQQLADSLDKLVQAVKIDVGSIGWDVPSAETQQKQRLEFTRSVSGAKQRLDAAEQQLKQPMICQLMKQEDGAAMERKLSNRLAQLNAAVAALAAATADREHPDYAAADRAVRTITELMPEVVQDSHKLCGTKSGTEQAAMLQDLKTLCEATRQICDSAGQPQGLSDAAAKFSAATGKLVYVVSPAADAKQQAQEKQVVALSAASCGKASELLTQAQRLTELIPDAAAAAELDSRGARAADAAQALLTVAQATVPTIRDPHCQKEVISAAEKLRSTASELTSSCQPHLQQRPDMKQQMLGSQQQLADSLDKLVQAVKTDVGSIGWDVPSAETQAKQRLEFINSVSGAKQRLDAAEQQLKQPMICQLMKQEDGAAMERKLSNSLAQLNAAVAALAAATADRRHPDYAAADRAVRTITELMPEVVQDSHKLCGTKSGAEQAAMLQDLKELCEATRQICDSAGQPQGLSDAAAKFSAATGKLVYVVSPAADAKQQAQEKQVVALSAASCGKASELLTQAQRLTELIPDAAAAAELDSRGARAADAAQALLTVAQATAPTIGDPHCQKAVISAAEKLRSTASDLTSSCQPHLQQRLDMKQQMLSSQQQLSDSLDKLVQACKTDVGSIGWVDAPSAQTQEKQRLKFFSSMSGAKEGLDAAEQELKKPMICQMMRQEDGAAIERNLSNKLAQLNAAVAALAAATANREKPDYVEADRAARTIAKLMPQVVQDSHKLCGTKSGTEQAAMLQHLKALCEATRQICDSAGQPQDLSDAAAKFSAASGKLVYTVSPDADTKQVDLEKQVIALSAATCGKASELLSQAQRLTNIIPDAGVAAEIDDQGSRAADSAQTLLLVAQMAAPTIGNPHCQERVVSAAEKLHSSASKLTSLCEPHLQQPEMRQQMLSSKIQLDDTLDKLKQACNTAHTAHQEKHRVKFNSSASEAKNNLQEAQAKLSLPIMSKTKPEDPAPLQRRLSNSLAQLNAAIAALTAATADRKYPDYETAHQAVEAIPKLLREVIHDSRELCANKTGPGAVAVTNDLTALCEASRELCESVGQPQGLAAAAAKYSAASSKMTVLAGPKTHSAEEKQVMSLSSASCGKVSELSSQVQRLAQSLPVGAAEDVDERRARMDDAAQALLATAQVSTSSISEPACAEQLISAAGKLRSTASELTSWCSPHLQQRPDMKQPVLASHQQLNDSLDKLILACEAAQQETEVVLSPEQEKQRIKFATSISGAKKHLDTAEQQMKKPVVPQKLKQADGASLQHQLSRRLAQLNAAVAALAAATQDGKNPDYPAAERAVITITELMPQVVHDSHTLSSTKDAAGQAAMLEQLRQLCDASRAICDSHGQPKKLHEASAKLANASSKLVYIVSPESAQGSKPAVPLRKAPPPAPARDPNTHTIAQAVRASAHADSTKDFLDTLRGEESQAEAKRVAADTKHLQALEEAKKAYKRFMDMIDSAEQGLKNAKDGLKVLHSSKTAAACVPAVEVARREQHMEDSLAQAGVQVAALVAANYADELDYKAAMEPTLSLTESVRSVVNDGSAIYSSLPEPSRKPFVDDMVGLCRATTSICDATKSKEEVKKLNDAAISFGDRSIKLLRVVSCMIDPALEKQVISRAKAIGDTASRLALEASNVASSADSSTAEGKACVQDICSAGASCVDTAGKLVYTAKLIAPTIHHATCQDTLVSSADNLSASLTKFSKTWAPLASSQKPNVQKLTQEAAHLEDLVERLRKDVKSGKFGKRKEVEKVVNLDSPLREMTMQIIETAKSMADYGELSADQRKEYVNYSQRLEEAVRALDLANARYQRAPTDKIKYNELEIATQDLQVTLLQTRPSRAGQEQNNIVDFRDFLQDLVREADQLLSTAKKNEGAAGKRTTDDMKLLCSKISEDATRLLNPPDHFGDGVTVLEDADDIMDIDVFGQECDTMVKEINNAVQGVHDQKAKQALRAKALALTESCHLLRFATYCHIMEAKDIAFNDALTNLDDLKTTVIPYLAKEAARKSQKEKKVYSRPACSGGCAHRATWQLAAARGRARLGEPAALLRATTYVAAASTAQPHYLMANEMSEEIPPTDHLATEDKYERSLKYTMDTVHDVFSAYKSDVKCQPIKYEDATRSTHSEAHNILQQLNHMDHKMSSHNLKTPVLNSEDINKLLLCTRTPVEGTPKQLEEKLQQLSTKLSSMSGTIVLSAKKPESLARSLHAAADVAVQLANTARALQNSKKPGQCKKIEEASHEMCHATYKLLKTSELVCQEPNHHDTRRKLLEACRHLNDSINTLVRSVNPTGRVKQECGEVQRSLQLQRSLFQGPPQPCGALPYGHCVETLQSQRDVLQKLNSEQAMSREEFFKSLHYVTSAVSNSTECAAQAAYLISVSEKDESIGKEGLVDVARLHKAVGDIEETCVSIIMAKQEEQVQEEAEVLKVQVQDLLHGLDDGIKKTKASELREMLKQSRDEVDASSTALFVGVKRNATDKEAIMSKVMDLWHDVNDASELIEHPDLLPAPGTLSADTQGQVDELVKSSLALLTNTEELVKQVKAAPEEPEVMKWVMFNKRKDVLDAFENLLKNIKTSGQRVKLIEEDPEEEKSYVQKQFDAASRWLLKPVSKAEVKTNGQQAVRNLIEIAHKITEDQKDGDEDDLKTTVVETEHLLTVCSKKYDQDQYSALMEHVRELKKGIERGVVTRVVHDFMDAEAPLADLDLVADYEKDESKRKFLLERKIAELLAQLSRVTKTARLIADTDKDKGAAVTTQLNTCSQQAELLAPMLVKAAQQRVASPDDKAVIENYKSLLARYAESLSKIRDLCDQSVDPMDFVQTAGETMERMREESTQHNDPQLCAHTSAAITKLANRVINVGLSSSTAKSDPELQKALSEAQQQLSAATPPADTRASRMPDWKDTTAKILQATGEVESLLGGENVFKTQPGPNQPIYNEALNLHVAIRDWSSRDNEIVAVAKRMAVLMARLSNYMSNDKQCEVLATSKSIVAESHEVARLAKKLAHECTDHRIKTNLLQTCERIPTISGQLKMLTTVKGFSLGRHGTQEDKEALDMLVGNAQSLMLSIQDVVKGAASASVKIMSQRGLRMKWKRKNVY